MWWLLNVCSNVLGFMNCVWFKVSNPLPYIWSLYSQYEIFYTIFYIVQNSYRYLLASCYRKNSPESPSIYFNQMTWNWSVKTSKFNTQFQKENAIYSRLISLHLCTDWKNPTKPAQIITGLHQVKWKYITVPAIQLTFPVHPFPTFPGEQSNLWKWRSQEFYVTDIWIFI